MKSAFCRSICSRSVGAAQLAELRRVDVLAVRLFDLQFDRQAVAVPARHVGRVEPGQRLGLDDDVLEDLVDRVADVDVAVGVGRAVVQDELGAAGGSLADALVAFLLLPALDPAGLALGEVAAHREGGVGQVEGAFVISHGVIRMRCFKEEFGVVHVALDLCDEACRGRGIFLRRAACAENPPARGGHRCPHRSRTDALRARVRLPRFLTVGPLAEAGHPGQRRAIECRTLRPQKCPSAAGGCA